MHGIYWPRLFLTVILVYRLKNLLTIQVVNLGSKAFFFRGPYFFYCLLPALENWGSLWLSRNSPLFSLSVQHSTFPPILWSQTRQHEGKETGVLYFKFMKYRTAWERTIPRKPVVLLLFKFQEPDSLLCGF